MFRLCQSRLWHRNSAFRARTSFQRSLKEGIADSKEYPQAPNVGIGIVILRSFKQEKQVISSQQAGAYLKLNVFHRVD